MSELELEQSSGAFGVRLSSCNKQKLVLNYGIYFQCLHLATGLIPKVKP